MTEFNKLRYAGIYLGAVILLVVISTFVSLPSGLATILPCMVAALIEGQKIAQNSGKAIEKSEAWAFARESTLLVLAINLVFMVLLFLSPLGSELPPLPPILYAVIFIVLMLVSFLTNRFFVTMGANSVLKAEKKKTK